MKSTIFTQIQPFLIAFIGMFFVQYGSAQEDRSYLEATDQDALKSMAERLEEHYDRNIQKARNAARKRGIPIRQEKEDGTIIELQGIDTANGELIYYTTNNLDAAKTTNTNKLWQGGGMNLSLSGNGYTIGEWDGGAVNPSHPDLSGRITQVDGASSNSSHSTHVAGTLVGNSSNFSTQYPNYPEPEQAKGMAYKANLDAYDFSSDDSEMSTAASNGLLVSNHSYGQVCGWVQGDYGKGNGWYWFGKNTVSSSEDYSFGFYSSGAANWDDIAYKAPNYLIVKSAGNDRNDDDPNQTHYVYSQGKWVQSNASRDNDGDYDCIPPKGTAKNILTVGAIKDMTGGNGNPASNEMTSFSSWGPADDGRIKPDIVGNGNVLYSCIGSSSYGGKSGTSMSSPNAAGSMLLLQEHYYNLYSSYMKAATLKGLVIHTANEAGNSRGPDYKFGWGLMDVAHAASVISKDSSGQYLKEESLANNSTYTFKVYSDGNQPLRATICWTDVPGTPPSKQVDPSNKMLVNDLDLRVKDPNNTSHKPFVLDPNNPSNAATTQDNDVDNVEQVFIANPKKGIHTIEVTHKGSLTNLQSNNAPQDFSLIINGAGTRWLGSSGTNWNSSSNWLGKIPNKDQSAFIPEGKSNYPEITGTRKVRNLFIENKNNSNKQGKVTVKSTGVLAVKSDITNKGDNNLGTGEVKMNGTNGQQQISGNSELKIGKLTIDNSNGVKLETPFKVNNTLNLTNGVVQIPASNDSLILADNANGSPDGGKSASYISGKVTKIGDDAFTFPIGDNGKWARMAISAPQNTTDAFTASYNDKAYSSTSTDNTLQNVSDTEYWGLDRVAGNSDVKVTLHWEDGSASGSNIGDTADLTIGHFNGSQWTEETASTNGNVSAASGKISTDNVVTSFSPFTFGSLSNSSNPLPVELLNFAVKQKGESAFLKWVTASETQNQHFIVQEKVSGDWKRIGKVAGNGNTLSKHKYKFLDSVFQKGVTHYYRLRQVDFNGDYEYSPVRSLKAEREFLQKISISPNPVANQLKLSFNSQQETSCSVKLLNLLGIQLVQNEYLVQKGVNKLTVPVESLKPGQYILLIEANQEIVRKRFIKK